MGVPIDPIGPGTEASGAVTCGTLATAAFAEVSLFSVFLQEIKLFFRVVLDSQAPSRKHFFQGPLSLAAFASRPRGWAVWPRRPG